MRDLIKEVIQDLLKESLSEELGVKADKLSPEKTEGHDKIPVVVCTDKRAVVFGFTENKDADPISVTEARMCIYWSKATGGVFGLCEKGPDKDCKISATAGNVSLSGITAVFDVTDTAISAWQSAPVQGR